MASRSYARATSRWMASAPAEGRIVTSSPALVDGTAYVGLRDEDGVANNGWWPSARPHRRAALDGGAGA
jgi:hypothetical protein